MKKILILSTIWGHKSVGKGIYDAIPGGRFEKYLEVINVDPFSLNSYKTIYRFVPWFFGSTYQLSKFESANKLFDKFFEKNYFKTIERLIKKYRPDIVISSYFAFDSSIGKLTKKYKFRYLSAFTDPWTFSRIHISTSGLNLVFDEKAYKKLKRLEPNAEARIIGWFTEQKYYEGLEKTEARKKLGIDPDILTFCIAGGSEGTYDILKTINPLLNIKHDLQMLFMCGGNDYLFKLIKTFAKIAPKNIKIIPFRYTKQMELYIKASDLVIGKAGPSSIFESIVCGVPFFAITHITGQEDGNLDLIKKYKIGIVEENTIKAARKMIEIVNKPSILDSFNKPIRDCVSYISGSGGRLLKIISE